MVPGSKNDVDADSLGYTPKKKRPPSAFSLFIQKHSSQVRLKLEAERSGKSVSQTEVMKECGRLWKLEKAEEEESKLDDIVGDIGKMSINEA